MMQPAFWIETVTPFIFVPNSLCMSCKVCIGVLSIHFSGVLAAMAATSVLSRKQSAQPLPCAPVPQQRLQSVVRPLELQNLLAQCWRPRAADRRLATTKSAHNRAWLATRIR